MKKKYFTVQIQLWEFSDSDVISTSTGFTVQGEGSGDVYDLNRLLH